MSTTTIRLSDELKERITRLAVSEGTTAHGFIVGAIEERVRRQELRNDFHQEAVQRWQQFLVDGQAIPWNEMREYMLRRARGESPPRPAARTLGTR